MKELKVNSNIMEIIAMDLTERAGILNRFSLELSDICRDMMNEKQLSGVGKKLEKTAHILEALSRVMEKMSQVLDDAENMYYHFENRISEEVLKI